MNKKFLSLLVIISLISLSSCRKRFDKAFVDPGPTLTKAAKIQDIAKKVNKEDISSNAGNNLDPSSKREKLFSDSDKEEIITSEGDLITKATPGEIGLDNGFNKNETSIEEKESFTRNTVKKVIGILIPTSNSNESSSPADKRILNNNESEKTNNNPMLGERVSQPPLNQLDLYKEFTFSGLAYDFLLEWDHMYVNNKVIYLREEDNGNKSLFTLEAIDLLEGERDFEGKGKKVKNIEESLKTYGFIEKSREAKEDLLLLMGKGIGIRGVFSYENVEGYGTLYIFTSKDKAFIMSVISSSAKREEVNYLADKVLDGIIRGN